MSNTEQKPKAKKKRFRGEILDKAGVDKGGALTPQQWLFVQEYLTDLNATRAYTIAYPKGKHPKMGGRRLLDSRQSPNVAEAIRKGLEEKQKICKVEAVRVVEELAKIAFFNPQEMFDEDGVLLPLHLMPSTVACAIREIEVSTRQVISKDRKTTAKTMVSRIKIWDKLDALRQLALHLGYLHQEREREEQRKNLNENGAGKAICWDDIYRRSMEVPKGNDRLEEMIREASEAGSNGLPDGVRSDTIPLRLPASQQVIDHEEQ